MNSTFRRDARKSLKNLWGFGVLVTLIYTAIVSAGAVVWLGIFLVAGPLSAGVAIVALKVSRNESSVKIESLFEGFRQFLDNLVLCVLEWLYVFLWSILLIIPGIVKMYAYSLCYFVKADNPEYSASECLAKSNELMRGNKWRLFCLDLSFIGWEILTMFTFGIGVCFLAPYIMVSKANFYNDLISQNTVATITGTI